MNAQVINKIEILIEFLNPKQQSIANKLKIDKNYRFFESIVRGESEVFFEDLSTKQVYHFTTHIKNVCQCD
jgi:hypothetical protein